MNQRCKEPKNCIDSEPVNHYTGGVIGSVNHQNIRLNLGGNSMATDLKRFMISVTPSMEADLNVLKKERFYNNSQAEMLRYVIGMGLKSLKISEKNADEDV